MGSRHGSSLLTPGTNTYNVTPTRLWRGNEGRRRAPLAEMGRVSMGWSGGPGHWVLFQGQAEKPHPRAAKKPRGTAQLSGCSRLVPSQGAELGNTRIRMRNLALPNPVTLKAGEAVSRSLLGFRTGSLNRRDLRPGQPGLTARASPTCVMLKRDAPIVPRDDGR